MREADFSAAVLRQLASRSGHKCALCKAPTSGASINDPLKSVNIGVGAHITAASPGGPRYDLNLTIQKRKSADNGIWLCETCSKIIDKNQGIDYPASDLRKVKFDHEQNTAKQIGRPPDEANIEAALEAKIGSRLEEIIQVVSRSQGVPLEALQAILSEMGDHVDNLETSLIEQKLRQKASEFNRLVNRFNQISETDPEILRLRDAAMAAIYNGCFREADRHLEQAEIRDLAIASELLHLSKQKYTSAASIRADRAEASLLQFNLKSYLDASDHYLQAARITASVDTDLEIFYLLLEGETLLKAGIEFSDIAAMRQAEDRLAQLQNVHGPKLAILDFPKISKLIGDALAAQGEISGDMVLFNKAIDFYQSALCVYKFESCPHEWASTQNALGGAFLIIGKRNIGSGFLEKSTECFLNALRVWNLDSFPTLWASGQNNLGIAKSRIADRDTDTSNLHDAVSAFYKVLQIWKRDTHPFNWGSTQNNLGHALSLLGGREVGTTSLDLAATAFQAALSVISLEDTPVHWATTASNLANVLLTLGRREGGSERFREAINILNDALSKLPFEVSPVMRSMIQHNLANAYASLGDHEDNNASYPIEIRSHEFAIGLYEEALDVRTKESAPNDWAATSRNLASSLQSLGWHQRGSEGVRNILRAISIYREVLNVWTRESSPRSWAGAHLGLGSAFSRLGHLKGEARSFHDAIEAYQAAISVFTFGNDPLNWSGLQHNIGNTFRSLGELLNKSGDKVKSVQYFEEAVCSFRKALIVRTEEVEPLLASESFYGLACALNSQGLLLDSKSILMDAAATYQLAASEYVKMLYPTKWAIFEGSRATILEFVAFRSGDSELALEALRICKKSALMLAMLYGDSDSEHDRSYLEMLRLLIKKINYDLFKNENTIASNDIHSPINIANI